MTQAAATNPCPVCTAASFAAAFTAVGHRFERCAGCGFVRMADPLSSRGLSDFYRDDRMSGEAAWQEHDANLVRFDGILRRIERYVPVGRFLDVGCSIGTSLQAAARRGWQAIGLELSQPAADYGRRTFGVDIRATTLAAAGFADGQFDAVLMHHTLEHVEAPDLLVEQIARVLAPGGVMYQSLPNHGSLKGRLLGPHFGYGVTVEHLSHFDKRSLRRLVQRQGLRVRHCSTRSYRQDPRLLWDLACRLGRQRWLQQKCGLPPGKAMDQQAWVAFLARNRWAYWLSNKAWPARLCGWLGLGEDLHLVAQKPR